MAPPYLSTAQGKEQAALIRRLIPRAEYLAWLRGMRELDEMRA